MDAGHHPFRHILTRCLGAEANLDVEVYPPRDLHAGDVLVLTKPLGTGILTTALKRDAMIEAGAAAGAFDRRACLPALRRIPQREVTLRECPAQRHEVDAGGADAESDDQEKHRHEGEGP